MFFATQGLNKEKFLICLKTIEAFDSNLYKNIKRKKNLIIRFAILKIRKP